MPVPQNKTININGVKVNYVQAGEGPFVLLVHGLGASLVTWTRNIQPLAQAGFTAVAIDLPGHGDSDKPKDLTYGPVTGARLLKEFADALGVERLSLVGNSAGGLIAGLFALEYTEMTERLVLVASGGLGKRLSWFLRVMTLPVLGEIVYQPWLLHLTGLDKRIFFKPQPFEDEVMEELHRVRSTPGSRAAALRAVRSSVDYSGLKKRRYILDRLKKLPVPLMTVWGLEDKIIPVSHAYSVSRELPNSVFRVMPECGHWPHMEKAEEFNQLLTAFLGGFLDHKLQPASG